MSLVWPPAGGIARRPTTLLHVMSTRALACLGVLLLTLGACESAEPAAEVAAASPSAVVADWIAALEALDIAGLTATTVPANVALVAGSENGFTTEQMVAIVDNGMPPGTTQSYWATFRLGLTSLLGDELGEVTVGEAEEYSVGGSTYAAVPVTLDTATTEVITFRDDSGWHVDLVATVGPALAIQLRRLVAQLVEEADDGLARRYALLAVGSLGAALERNPNDRALELELEAIEDLPIDLTA